MDKKMLIKIVALLISLDSSRGVLNNPSESDHTKNPPIFHLDPYKECILEHGDYCSVKVRLVSDQPSQLLQFLEEHSAHKLHFNHTVLSRGICLTKTCKQFLKPNTMRDPRVALEGCLNKTLWQDYGLKAKLIEEPWCHKAGESAESIGALDVTIAVLLAVVLVLNLVGSLREFTASEKDRGILSSFSLQRNWQALTGPSRLTDPRMEGMKAFSGIRGISCILVICCHAMLPFTTSSSNTSDLEEAYKYLKFILTGGVMINTFFALSGFLMGYFMAANEGESRMSCVQIVKLIFLRWLRLAPPMLVVLALVLTWIRFVGNGPLWQPIMGDHLESCRRYWWLVPLNLVNYVDGTHCFAEYWYIFADMQLTVLGLLVVGLLRGRARWWALGALLVAGVVAPAAHTWAQDLDGWLLLTPELGRNLFFVHDATFNHVHKRAHTNIAGYVIGVALGLLTFGWQRDNVLKKYHDKLGLCRVFCWCIVPLLFATILPGSVFHEETPVYIRVVYSLWSRPVFAALVAIGLAALTLQIEDVYRPILSWRGWALPARLSYCVYVVHFTLIRLFVGSQTTLMQVSIVNALCLDVGFVVVSFLAAVPLWLLVEAPTSGLCKHFALRYMTKPVSDSGDENNVNDSGKQNIVSDIGKQNKVSDSSNHNKAFGKQNKESDSGKKSKVRDNGKQNKAGTVVNRTKKGTVVTRT